MFESTVLRRLRSAVVTTLAVSSSLLLVPAASAETVDEYVAMGDSYSSGNGTYAADLDASCYRSTYAYPHLVGLQRPDTDLTFVACQGATTDDIISGQDRSLDADTDYVTLTIGGNDIGFADLIVNCAGWLSPNCQAAVDEANGKIENELPGKLDKAYAAITEGAPNVEEVVVLGYARFFGEDVSCAAAHGISAAEATWLNGVADNLDVVVRDRATASGFTYRSSIRAFTGHDVCAPDPYLNGNSFSPADAYHPTRSGHANGLAPLVREAIG